MSSETPPDSDFFCIEDPYGEPPCAGVVTLKGQIEQLRREKEERVRLHTETVATIKALVAERDALAEKVRKVREMIATEPKDNLYWNLVMHSIDNALSDEGKP